METVLYGIKDEEGWKRKEKVVKLSTVPESIFLATTFDRVKSEGKLHCSAYGKCFTK